MLRREPFSGEEKPHATMAFGAVILVFAHVILRILTGPETWFFVTAPSDGLAFAITPMARILLIDDDAAIRKLLCTVLRSFGHTVVEAANGREGLKLSADADLVILDIFMPEMDGIEVLMELRRRHAKVKVIATSGNVSSEAGDNLQAARLLGAVQTLIKPFTLKDLTAAVNGVLSTGGESLQVSHP
jgi:CheY-like chemotaxis protein